MAALTIEPFVPAHTDRVVELSLLAWAPVFASFEAVLGERLYQRVHPDWRRDQAESVRAAVYLNPGSFTVIQRYFDVSRTLQARRARGG